MEYPLIYIIILHYHFIEDTLECINSCRQLHYENYKILVIDNSNDNSIYQYVQEDDAVLEYMYSGGNIGYAAANNIGIKIALNNRAQFIWLLNNDTTVDSSSLYELYQNYVTQSKLGFLGSKVLRYYAPTVIDYLGGTLDAGTGIAYHDYRGKEDRNIILRGLIKTDFVTGCSMFFSADVYRSIGPIDESYFLYCEDIDWCICAAQKGYQHYVCPSSIVYHKVHASSSILKGLITYYHTRNTLYLIERKLSFKLSSWIRRLLFDAKRVMSFLMELNLRAAVNVINAYMSWVLGLQGAKHDLKFVRKNIFIQKIFPSKR